MARRVRVLQAHLQGHTTGVTVDESTLDEIQTKNINELRQKYGRADPDGIQLNGLNHLALVSSDMDETCRFYGEVLGLRLSKTIELHDGSQHFFFDIGAGQSLAFFWFAKGVKQSPGVASVDPKQLVLGDFATADGSMNHVAFSVPEEKLAIYRERLEKAGIEVSPILFHADVKDGFESRKSDKTIFQSCYFFGPDGEYLEFTSQAHDFTTPEHLEHAPKTAADRKA